MAGSNLVVPGAGGKFTEADRKKAEEVLEAGAAAALRMVVGSGLLVSDPAEWPYGAQVGVEKMGDDGLWWGKIELVKKDGARDRKIAIVAGLMTEALATKGSNTIIDGFVAALYTACGARKTAAERAKREKKCSACGGPLPE